MTEWLILHNVDQVAMEGTGVYWVPTWNFLEAAGLTVMLVNPWFIKQMPGRKRDVADAQWIALLLHKGLPRGSLSPSKGCNNYEATAARSFVYNISEPWCCSQ